MNGELPKYQTLIEWIQKKIESGEFSAEQRIPTEMELVEKFGYSRQTVRQAIHSLEQSGMVRRIRGKGTFVRASNYSLRKKNSSIPKIGVLTTYLDDYIFPGIISGIERILTQKGYLVTLGVTHNSTMEEAASLRRMLSDGIDGLIMEGTKSALPTPNADILQEIRDAGIPIVFLNGFYGAWNDNYVLMDDVMSCELLTQLLIRYGHTKIGGIFKSDDMQGIKRYQGFIQALRNHGKHVCDDSVLWYTTEDCEAYFGGQMDAWIFSRLEQVSAVVCYNDEIAIKLSALMNRMKKRVPEDISIVGFDNSPLSAPQLYNLTTVSYPAKQIGEIAANMILKALEDSTYREHVKIEPEIVERGSVFRIESPSAI